MSLVSFVLFLCMLFSEIIYEDHNASLNDKNITEAGDFEGNLYLSKSSSLFT